MAELLEKTSLDAHQQRYLDIVRTSSSTLLTLINDILDFSKIEAERMTLESVSFDLYKLVEDVVDVFARQSTTKSLELVSEIDSLVPRHVQGDPTRLRQVLTNLVGNAVKFTTEGHVRVGVTATEITPVSALLRLRVQDSGIGIDSERVPRLFEAFSQEDTSTTRKYGGTGLGLSISRRLAELMGGTIGASSENGHGSTVWCEIPVLVDSAAPPVEINVSAASGLLSLKVLIVESQEASELPQLIPQLESWAMRVTMVSNPAEADEKLKLGRELNEPFGVMLVDLPAGSVALPADLRHLASQLVTITVVMWWRMAGRHSKKCSEAITAYY